MRVEGPLHFAAFVSATTEHGIYGTWRQDDGEQVKFNDVKHWVGLAKLLERGMFDFIFFSDSIGLQGPYNGEWRKHAEAGVFFPVNDPSCLAAVLAYETEHLGVAFTSSILQEHPFTFARKMSTLDHLTGGRVAWNIVTNALENGARNYGLPRLTPHDERYLWADEYVDVTYKLWEGSWDTGALRQDRSRGIHADYDRIHKIHHAGKRYNVEGPHLVSPSPQRTPFLFQAGASEAGREFAAKNAEAVFFTGADRGKARALVADIVERARRFGRAREELKFFVAMHFIVGSTDEEAARRAEEVDANMDYEAQLAHLGGSLGVDFGPYELDSPIAEIETDGIRSIAGWVAQSVEGRPAVVRDLATLISRDGRVVGTPERVADELAEWRASGIDGVNVFNITRPKSYLDFIEHVVPVLQSRGLMKSQYTPGTIREKIFGRAYVSETHPAARYRNAFMTSAR